VATRIYYFTGTGNSLWAARTLAEKLGETTLTPIVQALQDGEILPAEERIGIVFPVYMYRMPHIVYRFLHRLQTDAPIFAVATMGGDPGNMFAVAKRVFEQRGLNLRAAMTVKMPSNYIPFGGVPDDDELATVFEAAEERLDEIAAILERGDAHLETEHSRYRAWIHPGLLYKLGYKFVAATDGSYRLDDGCDACGICALVCPVENLVMVDDAPTWSGRCEQCMACVQWCPQQVIQVKDKTRGERRYHHPSVKSKDIVAQKRRKK